jgi:dTDP-4-dehydrorhamnose 3,5-epimerase
MKFYKQEFEGVWLVEAEPIVDNRGVFRRHFCQREFHEFGLGINIAQTNISENKNKYTLRGFHYQRPPHGEDKIITCLNGAIYNVIIDLRPDSKTFLKWMYIELKAEDFFSIYIPSGCANSFLTLKDSTTILYYMSEFYAPGSYAGIRYNDPLFSVKWPAEPLVISERDIEFPDFVPPSADSSRASPEP